MLRYPRNLQGKFGLLYLSLHERFLQWLSSSLSNFIALCWFNLSANWSMLSYWTPILSELNFISGTKHVLKEQYMWFSPTVLDGCTDEALSRDFCFLSLSLSRRLWQRWWWWWWWTLSCPWTGPDSVDDWAWSSRSRSYSLSSTSWWRCGVSEDAERRIGLRSTIGWVREGRHEEGGWESKAERWLWWFYPNHLYWITKYIHNTQITQLLSKDQRSTFFSSHRF